MKIQSPIALGARYNDLTAFIEEVMLPKMAKRFRQKTSFLNTIHLDGAEDVQEVGDKIKIAMPFDLGEADELAVDGSSNPTPYTAQKVEMTIDNHLYKEFTMSDRAFVTHNSSNTIPGLVEAAVDSVAMGVNKRGISLTKEVYNYIGTANGNMRTTNDVIDLADFLDGVCPQENRFLGLNRKTNGDLLKEMKDLSKFGREEIHSGMIGEYQGFNVFKDIGLPTVISGGAGSTYTLSAGASAGEKQIAVTGGTAAINKGEVLEIAGVPGTYVAVADYAGGAGTVSIYPALSDDASASAAVTVQDTHPMDIGYHKSAFAVAFRSLEAPQEVDGASVFQYTDPNTGIPYRLVRWYNGSTGKTHWKFEVLCGFSAIRPEWACRMLAG